MTVCWARMAVRASARNACSVIVVVEMSLALDLRVCMGCCGRWNEVTMHVRPSKVCWLPNCASATSAEVSKYVLRRAFQKYRSNMS